MTTHAVEPEVTPDQPRCETQWRDMFEVDPRLTGWSALRQFAPGPMWHCQLEPGHDGFHESELGEPSNFR